MIIALAVCNKDRHLAVKLAEWMRDLGGMKNRGILLCLTRSTDPAGIVEPLRETFGKVGFCKPDHEYDGWPEGPNSMFQAVAWHVHHIVKQPFLFMEPDAVPMHRGWFDDIEAAYNECVNAKKVFMGAAGSNIKIKAMNGVAVYPASVCDYSTAVFLSNKTAWDLNGAKEIVPHAVFNPLFQNIYYVNAEAKEAPQFPRDLHLINKETALFHRCKTGGLIDHLRGVPAIETKPEPEIESRNGYCPPALPLATPKENLQELDPKQTVKAMVGDLARMCNGNQALTLYARQILGRTGVTNRKKAKRR